MPKRVIKTAKDGSIKTIVEPYECEKEQLSKGDQAADKAWSQKNKSKAVQKPDSKKVK